ncbi:MAG: hypothetical protein V4685_02070 [Bacteroidota bacterium]
MKAKFSVKIILSLLLQVFFFCNHATAQLPMSEPDRYDTLFFSKNTKAENRQRLYKSLVSGINRNLSLPLTDSTEENWMDAFYSIELLRYKSPWVEGKVYEAFKKVETRSVYFQKALLELAYANYESTFIVEARKLLPLIPVQKLNAFGQYLNSIHYSLKEEFVIDFDKLFAITAEYLVRANPLLRKEVEDQFKKMGDIGERAVLSWLSYRFEPQKKLPGLDDLLHHPFFSKSKVVFSFQRKNRNYPGITVVRDSAGNFVKDGYRNIISVPQLARSINNLPGYLSNGNTPQGIFRMKGFDVSKSIFIGPTPNIQLTMPFETSLKHFFNDSAIIDSVWTEDWYKKLLPESWKNYTPFLETYYAGKAGRTEIIAHGTTVDPNYYKGTTYYPFTPTLGCLCTKEIWDEENGRRKFSDQQKLVEAIKEAGGADGYYIVIELDGQQKPVTIDELLPYLK